MHFEINVSAQIPANAGKPFGPYYEHLFATASRSIPDRATLARILPALTKAFPAPTYKISVTKWETLGEVIDTTSLFKPRFYVHTITSGIPGQKIRNPHRVIDGTTGSEVDEYASKRAAEMDAKQRNQQA